jgi:hypothetical protein
MSRLFLFLGVVVVDLNRISPIARYSFKCQRNK